MPDPDRAVLDARLIAAHEMGDTLELSKLYRQAAEQMGIVGDDDAAGFYLTQAFVFALEAGDPLADQLCRELKSLGRI